MTIPNLITSLRIILAPIFIIYLLNEKFLPALVVFVIAGLSDGADGLVARLFNQKSTLGSYLDPLADKILLVAAFVVLSFRGFVPSWLTVIVISRDVLILLGVSVLFINGLSITIRPSILSKATTCLQLATVFVVLSTEYFHFSPGFHRLVFWLTGLFTISSGLHYMYFWFQVIGNNHKAGGGEGKHHRS
ncbi:MAG: CDP-diacylglycerol--glycerol-3-phosphate 3-phosphatidyltransferase [Deltaproteobacteria bacterium]|nr:MAG: CDP-diacylglycerol--glycerol-3-phosphate 3-phosphatidyltransferase [Deltaproteobacteria bacterium]